MGELNLSRYLSVSSSNNLLTLILGLIKDLIRITHLLILSHLGGPTIPAIANWRFIHNERCVASQI